MPLTMAETGKTYTISRISGKAETKRHLENMGFVPGAEVTIVSELAGNLIINVKDARVGIGKELAARIFVA